VDSPDERDQTVERLLRQSLKTPAPGGATDACLDAETLAAWADGGLSASELGAVHLHVADCARCQDLAGTLARIRSAVPPAEPVRSSRRWLAWFVPVAAAAAAVAIWFAVPANPGAPVTDVALVREAPQAQTEARDTTAPRIPAPPPLENRRELQAAPSRVPQATGSLGERARADAAPPPAAEEKTEPESARSNLAKDKVEVAQAQAAQATTPPPPAAPRAAAAPQAAERFSAAATMRAANVVPDIVSPDPAVRWRIAGAAVLHSVDGGSTWEPVTAGGAADLTAGAAPAATVCWLVGRAGVVLLTTDGRTWRRLPFPEVTDLSVVRTVDAGGRVASVSTADGRTFVTTDAGASWVPR
jgi:hypothetical protein